MAKKRRLTPGLALLAGLLFIPPASRTNVPGDAAITFGVVADCQFASAMPDGERYYSRSRRKLANAISLFDRRGVRFIIHLGDLIDRDAASYDAILPAFERSAAPVHFVLGNHDFDIAAAEKLRVMDRLGAGPGYRAFTEGGWRFILLNGNELGFNFPRDEGLLKEAEELYGRLASEKRPNATKWNGGLGAKQMEFLEAELEQAEKAGQRVIICCHFPVFPPAAHNLWNDAEVVALLERHPAVKAYFNGHNHAGDYAAKDGLHFVTFRGMVETGDTSAGAVVTLTEDKIIIDGFGREPDRTLTIR